ncbi:hypothetical protein FHS91_003545 [Sphingobium xanthum]|jgi:hypothetical protein
MDAVEIHADRRVDIEGEVIGTDAANGRTEPAVEPERGVLGSSVTLGAIPDRTETSETAHSFRALDVKALMAIGTSCTFSARFCAVTTIF